MNDPVPELLPPRIHDRGERHAGSSGLSAPALPMGPGPAASTPTPRLSPSRHSGGQSAGHGPWPSRSRLAHAGSAQLLAVSPAELESSAMTARLWHLQERSMHSTFGGDDGTTGGTSTSTTAPSTARAGAWSQPQAEATGNIGVPDTDSERRRDHAFATGTGTDLDSRLRRVDWTVGPAPPTGSLPVAVDHPVAWRAMVVGTGAAAVTGSLALTASADSDSLPTSESESPGLRLQLAVPVGLAVRLLEPQVAGPASDYSSEPNPQADGPAPMVELETSPLPPQAAVAPLPVVAPARAVNRRDLSRLLQASDPFSL